MSNYFAKKGEGTLQMILEGGVPLALVLAGFFMIFILQWYFWGIVSVVGGVALFVLFGGQS